MPHCFCERITDQAGQDIGASTWWKRYCDVDRAIRKALGSVGGLRRGAERWAQQAQAECGHC